jgi:hypothetical protein|tara:strand:+ start:7308 stop:7862 length:555 start_codon:yes stop_codon:yes gene_type:complete
VSKAVYNNINFLCFTNEEKTRVIKVKMSELHKVINYYGCFGDPDFMSPLADVLREDKAVKIYNLYSKKKIKGFKNKKETQIKLWNLLSKHISKLEDQDLKMKYRKPIDLPISKPNTYCKVASPRDPFDTNQKIMRTKKVPIATKNIERMKHYEDVKTVQDVLDKGVLTDRNIKYDIKLGYVKKV